MSVHVRHPHSDGDKAVCGVRISDRPEERSFADTPARFVTVEEACERCYLRTLRTWQAIDEDIVPNPGAWTMWPWEDPRYVTPVKAL